MSISYDNPTCKNPDKTINVNNRDRILEAATRLFALRCRNELTIRDISHEAGCNSALISYYFGCKDKLYAEVIATQFRQFEEAIHMAFNSAELPETAIRNVCSAYFKFHSSNPYYLRLLSREMASPTSCYEEIVKPCISQIADKGIAVVKQGINSGTFRKEIEPGFVTITIAALANYFFLSQRLAADIATVPPERIKEFEDFTTDLLLRGLTTT